MKIENWFCDYCKKDLTETGNCIDYRLKLTSEKMNPKGDFLTLMNILPPINQDMYFCGVECLKSWIVA